MPDRRLVATAIVLTLFTPLSTPAAQEVGDAKAGITFSQPPAAPPEELAHWNQLYRAQFLPVESSWARFLQRLAGDQPRRFQRQCADLRASLAQVDATTLLPVPDRLIDLYLRRLLLHLDAAGTACARDELFNVVYRFEEAGSALTEVRWLLGRKGIGASK